MLVSVSWILHTDVTEMEIAGQLIPIRLTSEAAPRRVISPRQDSSRRLNPQVSRPLVHLGGTIRLTIIDSKGIFVMRSGNEMALAYFRVNSLQRPCLLHLSTLLIFFLSQEKAPGYKMDL